MGWDGTTYGAGGGLLLGALSIDLEGNTVGGGALDLKSGSRVVVEVLVQQLDEGYESVSNVNGNGPRE